MPEIVVTLDIGGSGVKASCFDVSGDVPTTAAAVPYPPGAPDDDGTFDPDVWADTATAALAQIVARCPARPHQYLGITVSAIRIPFVLLDADRRVVGPSLLNRDRRAQADRRRSCGHHRSPGAAQDDRALGGAGVRPAQAALDPATLSRRLAAGTHRYPAP